jgi:hypothetical protein
MKKAHWVSTPDAEWQFWFDAVSSDEPQVDEFVFQVVPDPTVACDDTWISVLVFEQDHEYTSPSKNEAAVTCLPFHDDVENWNSERYMFVPSPALPTFA